MCQLDAYNGCFFTAFVAYFRIMISLAEILGKMAAALAHFVHNGVQII